MVSRRPRLTMICGWALRSLRPFNPVRFHGNWRWFFDYGTGDLGNDGVHRLDVALGFGNSHRRQRRGAARPPRSVSSTGGKYYFDDLQEWPDTLLVAFDYPGRVLYYEMRIWTPYWQDGEPEGAAVYGDQGYIVIGNSRWRAFDPKGKPVAEDTACQQRHWPCQELPGLHALASQTGGRSGNRRPAIQPAVPSGQRRLASRSHAAL